MAYFDVELLNSGLELKFWRQSRFRFADLEQIDLTCLGARLNILASIKAAGSGHIGTSFSSIDIMLAVYSYFESRKKLNSSQNDLFFTSKGHDAPALYAALHIKGDLNDHELFKLRRLNGLPGHPEIGTSGVHTNTGSLGMGISKAKGFVKANRLKSRKSRVVVLLGDGELQEGQIWEALATASRDQMGELVVIVDGNKIQSDTWVNQNNPYENLGMRVRGSGWDFRECNGHNVMEVVNLLGETENGVKPLFIYANTVKGFGVSIFEEFPEDGLFYKFHSGSVSDELYEVATCELIAKISGQKVSISSQKNTQHSFDQEADPYSPKQRPESLITEWAEYLNEIMIKAAEIVVLDADLSYDTGTYKARVNFPDRYVQCGISEQDMVSMAGTLALSGFVPIVHSFATFLTMRPTEQIFNNATEETSVIYLGFLAGLLPSPPGFSHQAVNDIGIMNSIPGMDIFEPACGIELRDSIHTAIARKKSPTYIRIGSIGIAPNYDISLKKGSINVRKSGEKILVLTSGPLLTIESIRAAQILESSGLNIAVATIPHLNVDFSGEEIQFIGEFKKIYVVENFIPTFSIFTALKSQESIGSRIDRIGLDGIPKNGWNEEVLAHHGLDANSIARKIKSDVD
jgi:transketolase